MAGTAPLSAREQVRPIAPKLVELAEKVVYGDVWERPGLSKRDRSLITVATLVALGRSGSCAVTSNAPSATESAKTRSVS